MTKHLRYFLSSLCLICFALTTQARPFPSTDIPTAIPTAINGMVSTQDAIASHVGRDILKAGGNAVDAVVAVGFALAVTYPRAGNLGGGGFMLIYLGEQERATAIDYREVAPAAAHRDMFLDASGNVDSQKSLFSAQASGIPGTVAGLIYALNKYGTMPLAKVIQPAIDLATNGFLVPAELNRTLSRAQARIGQYQTTADTYYPKGTAPAIGSTFKQPDLANVLRSIREKGRAGFYAGKVANMLVADSQANNGLMTMDDLSNYQVVERLPVQGTYRGHTIIAMPPPSSGGIHLIQMLNILEHWDIKASQLNSVKTINIMVEAMKYAYADRSKHLGDPGFYDVPTDFLLSKAYAKRLHHQIEANKVTPSKDIMPVTIAPAESDQTTHYTVMDRFGNAVANTYTLNASYGNGRVAKGTGIIMNNQMDDFSAKPGTPNMFGLIGGTANAIEPGKRPLSSMTPTIVLKSGRPLLAIGSVGGSRIITTVLQGIVNVIVHNLDIVKATKAPRFHHQWTPDTLIMEAGFESDVIEQLRAMGYVVDVPESTGHSASPATRDIGYLQSVVYRNGKFSGYADPRRPNALAVGY